MKNKRVLILMLVFTLLLNCFPAYAGETNSQNQEPLSSEDSILANEAIAILNGNSKVNCVKPEKLTLNQTEALYKMVYPEILEYVSVENLYTWISLKEYSVNSLETAIHEENHVYNYSSAKKNGVGLRRLVNKNCVYINYRSKRSMSYRYIIDGHEYLMKQGSSFVTSKSASLIPEDYRASYTKNYSFNRDSLTNQMGIYGIIDEYNSYAKDTDFYINYVMTPGVVVHGASGTVNSRNKMLAEIEANMLAYLIYAKENYPEQYKELMENETLRNVYSRTRDNIGESLEKYRFVKTDAPIYLLLKDEKFAEMQENFYIPTATAQENITTAAIETAN